MQTAFEVARQMRDNAQRRKQASAQASQAERVPGSRWRPGDYGQPDCPTCRGTGYVRFDLPPGHPQFGQLALCDCASENFEAQAAYRRAAVLSRASGLGEQAMGRRWASIRAGVNPALDAAVQAVRQVIERGYGWVYLWGPPGTGKTLLLQAAVAESAAAGRAAAWVDLADMLGALRAGFADGTTEARINDWRGLPVLALDEMGKANDTAWAGEVAFRILNHRYAQAVQELRGVTLFAANYSPDQFPADLRSRLCDRRNVVVHIPGQDVRKAAR